MMENMIIISHRGNTDGPQTASHGENHPNSIIEALSKNYDVEIDVWLIDDKYVLGHDKPEYEINKLFFTNRLWCHAKNLPALHNMIHDGIHCFYHNTDDATITSKGWIWTYPGKQIISNSSIAVIPETIKNYDISKSGGFCSDYTNYLEIYK